MTKLSILIPTTPDRHIFMRNLFSQFIIQLHEIKLIGLRTSRDGVPLGNMACHTDRSDTVEIITFEDNGSLSIGHKRNMLMQSAKGEYIAFVDSDDRIGPNYFRHTLEGISLGADCCSLKGIITEDGKNPLIFEHSIKYSEYKTQPNHMPVRYERFPNHLNCIKYSIAKQFQFPEKNHGEDTDWATQIHKSGLIKTEHYIDEIIYYYDWISKK